MSKHKQMYRDYCVIVFDDENPDGNLCSDNGKWATLFNNEEANAFVEEYGPINSDSYYRIFKLIEVGL